MNKQTQMVIFGAVAAVIVLAVGAYFLFSGGDDGTSTTAPPPAPINVGGGDPLQPAQLGTGASPFGGGAAPSMPSSMTAKPAEERAFVARKDPFAYLPKEQEAMQVGAYDMAGFYRAAGPPKPPPPRLSKSMSHNPIAELPESLRDLPYPPFWSRKASYLKSFIRVIRLANFESRPLIWQESR